MYAPIVFVGLLSFYYLTKANSTFGPLLLAVIGMNVLLYSMWGDPWGGWAFGSRYLIPSYALCGIALAFLLTRFARNSFVLLFVFGISLYSISINTIGALTTSRIPPKVQVLGLEEISGVRQRYTYTRSMEMLDNNFSKSVIFGQFAHTKLSAWQYTRILIAIQALVLLVGLLYLLLEKTAKANV